MAKPRLGATNFGTLQTDGTRETISSVDITTQQADSNGDIALVYGTTVPTDGSSGFAKGCRFIKTNVATNYSGVYENVGTSTSCLFSLAASNAAYTATIGFANADYVCDGVADDVQFNQAINAVNAAGGGVIKVQAGSYSTTGDIVFKSNVYIVGSGPSSVITLGARKYIKLDNISFAGISDLGVDGTNQLTAFFDKAIRILDSTDVKVERIVGTNLNAFGVFTEASAANTTSRIWIRGCSLFGRGNNDIIGGGPQNSTGATVENMYILDNYVYQDSSLGANYATGIDVVALSHSTIANNKVYGNLILGNEQSPNKYCSISGNIVKPANGNSFCYISVQSNATAVLPMEEINISNNIVDNGYIYVYGVVTAYAKNITISSNNVKWVGAQGIKLDHCLLSSVTGNIIDGATNCIHLVSTNFVSVTGNVMTNATRGITGSAVTYIAIGENVFSGSVGIPIFGVGTIGSVNNSGANPYGTNALGNVTGSVTFDSTLGNLHTATLTGNITTTINSGTSYGDRIVLKLMQDAVGGRTVSKPANVKLVGGTFSPSAGANAIDSWVLMWDGTNWNEISRSLNVS